MKISRYHIACAALSALGCVWTLSISPRSGSALLLPQFFGTFALLNIVLQPFRLAFSGPEKAVEIDRDATPPRTKSGTASPTERPTDKHVVFGDLAAPAEEPMLFSPGGLLRWVWAVPLAFLLSVPIVAFMATLISFGILAIAAVGAALFVVSWPLIELVLSFLYPGRGPISRKRASIWLVCTILCTGYAIGIMGAREAGYMMGSG